MLVVFGSIDFIRRVVLRRNLDGPTHEQCAQEDRCEEDRATPEDEGCITGRSDQQHRDQDETHAVGRSRLNFDEKLLFGCPLLG